MIHPAQQLLRPAAALCALLLVAGCASVAETPGDGANAAPSTTASVAVSAAPSASEPAASGPQPLEGGDLAAGAVHFSNALGVSVQPTEDDWFALLTEGDDFMLTRERIAVWFVRPMSIRPDGTAASTADAPTDPAELADALDQHPAVTVVGTEPFTAGALEGLLVDIESSGMAEASAILLTGDGAAYGFPDGEGRLLLLTTDAGPVMVSVEGGESRDAAWAIAEPLITTIDAAP